MVRPPAALPGAEEPEVLRARHSAQAADRRAVRLIPGLDPAWAADVVTVQSPEAAAGPVRLRAVSEPQALRPAQSHARRAE